MNSDSGSNAILEAEREHRALDQELRQLERRAFLTPTEQRQVADLKKKKLRAKDRLHALKRER
jgi:uncharacterized protein YdcH (DUF465 family)